MAINVSDVGKLVVKGKEIDTRQSIANKAMVYDGTKFSPAYVNTVYDTSASADLLINGNFESGDFTGWAFESTGSVDNPTISTGQVHSGTYSALIGQTDEPVYGDCVLYQDVAIPAGGATLSFWAWFWAVDSITFDQQIVQIRDENDNVLQILFYKHENTQVWTQFIFPLDTYAGQTIRITFIDHMDGAGDPTFWHLDDVSVIPNIVNTVATFSHSGIQLNYDTNITGTLSVNGSSLNTAAGFNYGHGGDGYANWVTAHETVVVARPKFHTELIVNDTVVISTTAAILNNPTYMDISATTSILIQNNSQLDVSGNTGGNGQLGTGIAGVGAPALGLGMSGGDGAAGSIGAGASAIPYEPKMTFAAIAPTYECTVGSSGGAGGASTGLNGGDNPGGVSNAYMSPASFGFINNYRGIDLIQFGAFIASGGVGGSSGAGNGSDTNGCGGAGGGSGSGAIVLRAPTITIGSGCSLIAVGGAGGVGGGNGDSVYGAGGGGGGGHGGFIILVCETLNLNGLLDFDGGNGGLGGPASPARYGFQNGPLVQSSVSGDAGNSITITITGRVPDAGGVIITPSAPNVDISYETGVTTAQNLTDAISLNSDIVTNYFHIAGSPPDGNALVIDNVVSPAPLFGGGDAGGNGDHGVPGEAWWYKPSSGTWNAFQAIYTSTLPTLADATIYTYCMISDGSHSWTGIGVQAGTFVGQQTTFLYMVNTSGEDGVYIEAAEGSLFIGPFGNDAIDFSQPGDKAVLTWNGSAWEAVLTGNAQWD